LGVQVPPRARAPGRGFDGPRYRPLVSTPDDPTQHGPDIEFLERRTARLLIRRFCSEDVPSFAAYRSDPSVARFQGWDVPYSIDDADAFVAGLVGAHPDTPGEWFQFAVVECASGSLIGDVAALVDADDARLATVGVTFAASAQGQGYATESVAWLLDYLLVEREKHRVAAVCDARNSDAQKLLERLGMRREALHHQSAWWKGEWTDEWVFAILRSEWLASRRHGEFDR